MELYNLETQTSCTESEFRAAFPTTSFPSLLTKGIVDSVGYQIVLQTPQPTITDLQVVVRSGVTQDTLGNYVQAWSVQDKFSTQEEVNTYLTQKATEEYNNTIKQFEQAIQSKLDQAAKDKGYDDIVSACSYAATVNPFQQESINFLNWRAGCWSMCYQILADVKAGNRTQPTLEEVLLELPTLVLS